jgi:hypothetical protein
MALSSYFPPSAALVKIIETAEGAGYSDHQKLEPENNGISAGVLALNTGVLPEMAAVICNETNQFDPKVC